MAAVGVVVVAAVLLLLAEAPALLECGACLRSLSNFLWKISCSGGSTVLAIVGKGLPFEGPLLLLLLAVVVVMVVAVVVVE